jgi:hypothetical protein
VNWENGWPVSNAVWEPRRPECAGGRSAAHPLAFSPLSAGDGARPRGGVRTSSAVIPAGLPLPEKNGAERPLEECPAGPPAGRGPEMTVPDDVKRIIINHCSLVLLGGKPAALFTLRSKDAFAALSSLLRRRLDALILRESEQGLLVLVFEKERLTKTVHDREALAFLAAMGYPGGAPLCVILDHLSQQFLCHDLPHEIGLFLGYPVEDVLGFLRHKGRNYKLCGYWKVYGDVERAKRCFRRYDACREWVKNNFSSSWFFCSQD